MTSGAQTSPAAGRRDAAIELADPGPRGWGRVRRAAGWLQLVAASAVVLAVFAQVYLIGAYIFGAGEGALDAHKAVGWTANELEGVVLICALVAWLPRRDILLSLGLAVIGTVQVSLAEAYRWVGGLHPLFALVVFVTAAVIVRRRLAAYGVRPRRR
jgi:hypothetical protein